MRLAPGYSSASGTVTVFANTSAEAVGAALTGAIDVTDGGDTMSYVFGPDSVGATAADQKPFLAVVDGNSVSLAFEDMAGRPDCDYDYNDRTWAAISVGTSQSPIVSQTTATLTGMWGDATVATSVTATDETTYQWDYTLTNSSFAAPIGQNSNYGIGYYSIDMPDVSSVTLLSGDSVTQTGLTRYGDGSGNLYLWMGVGDDPGLAPGQSVKFSFTTSRVGIAQAANSWGGDSQVACTFTGFVSAPVKLAATTTDLATPTVTWPEGKSPSGMTLTATVTGANGIAPTGDVKFFDGKILLGTVALVAGKGAISTATFEAKGPAVGNHPIKAEYQGDDTYATSKSLIATVDLEVLKEGSEPLGPNPNPTGGSLTWADFKGTPPADPGYAAFTVGKYSQTTKFTRTTLSIDSKGTTNSECRGVADPTQCYSRFNPTASWVRRDPAAPAAPIRTASLLAHENLHLTISEWAAAKAAANRPSIDAVSTATKMTLAAARTAAKKATYDKMFATMNAFEVKWKAIDQVIQDAYDVATTHGSDPAQQANWQDNWKTLAQALLDVVTDNTWK